MTFDQSEQDVASILRHSEHVRKDRWTFLLTYLAPLAFCLLAALIGLAANNPGAAQFFFGAAAAFVFVDVGLAIQTLRTPSTISRRWLKYPQSRGRLVGPQTITLTDDGIAWSHPLGHGFASWSGVSRIERADECVLLYLGPNTVIGVPFRAFESSEEADSFASFATEQLIAARA